MLLSNYQAIILDIEKKGYEKGRERTVGKDDKDGGHTNHQNESRQRELNGKDISQKEVENFEVGEGRFEDSKKPNHG